MPGWWLSLGRSDLWGLPLPIIYLPIACAVLWLALEYTNWGLRCFATGGNARAAVLVGIPVKSIIVQSFVLAGGLSAVAGLLSTSILGSANPNIGADYMLPAFAAVFLGATSIRPGRFNAWGTVIAVYALAAGIDGCSNSARRSPSSNSSTASPCFSPSRWRRWPGGAARRSLPCPNE